MDNKNSHIIARSDVTDLNAGGARQEDLLREDLDWLAYLGRLAPDDRRGAFVLKSELPDERSSPRQVFAALIRATRRAFGPGLPIQFTDFELGRIWGRMRILLPQGREIEEKFSGELGWKAVAILGDGYESRPVTAYYRQRCMNPVRVISRTEAVVDTSEIIFTPYGQDKPQLVTASPAVDALFAAGARRLVTQYQSIREAQPQATLTGLLHRLFRFRR